MEKKTADEELLDKYREQYSKLLDKNRQQKCLIRALWQKIAELMDDPLKMGHFISQMYDE